MKTKTVLTLERLVIWIVGCGAWIGMGLLLAEAITGGK